MNTYVLSFKEIDKTRLMVVGGKGLNLGELSKIEEIKVPEGFCVTTKPVACFYHQNSTRARHPISSLSESLVLYFARHKESIFLAYL
jgi:phosphoenolpyruvate synthase/pyruvate phosphate dikinase